MIKTTTGDPCGGDGAGRATSRPSTPTLPSSDVCTENIITGDKPPQKYVKPRVGSQYQARVRKWPASGGRLPAGPDGDGSPGQSGGGRSVGRPPAKRGRPLKNAAASSARGEDSDEARSSLSSSCYSSRPAGPRIAALAPPRPPPPPTPTPLGGICIHKPLHRQSLPVDDDVPGSGDEMEVDQIDDYIIFARTLVLNSPGQDDGDEPLTDGGGPEAATAAELEATEKCVASMAEKYRPPEIVKKAGRGGGKKGRGTKRKLTPENDEEAWGMHALPPLAPQTEPLDETQSEQPLAETVSLAKPLFGDCIESLPRSPDEVSPCKEQQGFEEDEQMLSYLQDAALGGECDVAKFSIMVHLCRGRAHKARMCDRKRQQEQREVPDSAPLPLSQSWRKNFEQAFPGMLKGLRSRPGFAHSSAGFLACWASPTEGGERPTTVAHWHMRIWRTILGCGENILKCAGSDTESTKPSFSDLLCLLRIAYTAPPPELVFGEGHCKVEPIYRCLNSILEEAMKGRDVQAKLVDLVYDEKKDGVELASISKVINDSTRKGPVKLEELDVLRRLFDTASRWEEKVDDLTTGNETNTDNSSSEGGGSAVHNLAAAEQLVLDAKRLCFRPRSLVALEERISRAYSLRDRIHNWNRGHFPEKNENIRFISSLVKEARRIDLSFPEVSMMKIFHRSAVEWIDRATIAVRSKISLSELDGLIEKGESMPLNLSDLLDKLRSRARQAKDWLKLFESEFPRPYRRSVAGEDGTITVDNLTWLSRLRSTLRCADSAQLMRLVDLAGEGLRVPVEIECIKLLQLEIDAKNWSLRASKWLPPTASTLPMEAPGGKKAKAEELRDHLEKGDAIREKLPLRQDERDAWKLDYEDELKCLLNAADDWYNKYQPYLEGDNRRQQARCCISLPLLKQIVDEANGIHINLGNPVVKMSRILTQAENWFTKNEGVLQRCGIQSPLDPILSSPHTSNLPAPICLDEINAAVASASTQVPLDLDQAQQLQVLAKRVQRWYDRALDLAPKRSKRHVRGKGKPAKMKHSYEELVAVIDEASCLPVNTEDELERLRIQLSVVQSWKLQAQKDIRTVVDAFSRFRKERSAIYAPRETLGGLVQGDTGEIDNEGTIDSPKVQPFLDNAAKTEPPTATTSAPFMSPSSNITLTRQTKILNGGEKTVFRRVADLVKSTHSTAVYTAEESIAEVLDKVSAWCQRSSRIIASPDDVFDKRYFEEFDKFLEEGYEMKLFSALRGEGAKEDLDDKNLLSDLFENCGGLISDEITRMEKLKAQRDEFLSWSDETSNLLLSPDKKVSLEALKDLAEQSLAYPSSSEIVQKVRSKARAATILIEKTNLSCSSGNHISMQDAKDILAEGEKLYIFCDELKNIRAALRVARGWAAKVKKCGLEQGESQISEIKKLIAEHDSFLISMPEELTKLKQAMCGYCLCRQPYEGFMIGCDGCEEWYHGPCIGVTEERAVRFDKYICVRCTVLRVYQGCADNVALIIRKWTNTKDLAKARQIDASKHQRKVREKKREIEKLKIEIESLEKETLAHTSDGKSSMLALNADDRATHEIKHPGEQKAAGTSESKGSCHESDGKAVEVKVDSRVSSELSSDSSPVAATCDANSNDVQAKLGKASATLENCNGRMVALARIAQERAAMEAKEDGYSDLLRRWCALVRSSVLAPSTNAEAVLSRPRADGTISVPMQNVSTEARLLGLSDLPDVSFVVNAFSCLSWCLRALTVLARKPRVDEVRSLISQTTTFKLPEEKSARMLKSMVGRANLWQGKVKRALAAIPGETKPYDVASLTELAAGARLIPLIMPEESRLWNTIEDGGTRHCTCGGPSDGSFMLGCDKCDRWFHGVCVNLDKQAGDALSKWICPPCTAQSSLDSENAKHFVKNSTSHERETPNISGIVEDKSPHAPDPEKLWPPFGLADSGKAIGTLGARNNSDNDCADSSVDTKEQKPAACQASSSSHHALAKGTDTSMSELYSSSVLGARNSSENDCADSSGDTKEPKKAACQMSGLSHHAPPNVGVNQRMQSGASPLPLVCVDSSGDTKEPKQAPCQMSGLSRHTLPNVDVNQRMRSGASPLPLVCVDSSGDTREPKKAACQMSGLSHHALQNVGVNQRMSGASPLPLVCVDSSGDAKEPKKAACQMGGLSHHALPNVDVHQRMRSGASPLPCDSPSSGGACQIRPYFAGATFTGGRKAGTVDTNEKRNAINTSASFGSGVLSTQAQTQSSVPNQFRPLLVHNSTSSYQGVTMVPDVMLPVECIQEKAASIS